MRLDLLDRRVNELGRLFERGGPEEVQVVPDQIEPFLIRPRRGEAGDRGEYRRRGALPQFESGPHRRQPERHLVQVRCTARPAEPQVRLGHCLGQSPRDLALDHRFGHEPPHLGGHRIQRVDDPDPGLLQRLRGVEDPLRRVGLRIGGDSGGDLADIAAPIQVRCPADRPQQDELVFPQRRGVNAAYGQRPRAAVGPGVLHPEIEHRRVRERSRLPIQLLDPDPISQNLATIDHGATVNRGCDNAAGFGDSLGRIGVMSRYRTSIAASPGTHPHPGLRPAARGGHDAHRAELAADL